MAKRKKKAPAAKPEPLPVIGTCEISVKLCPKNSFPNLHYEIGNENVEGVGNVQFLVHVNQACYWMIVRTPDGENYMYQVNTEELMNAVLNVVAPRHAEPSKAAARKR